MPDLGLGELLVIGLVLLFAVGPERMPHAIRWLGKAYGQMRRAADELRRAFVLEADRLDEEERLRELRRRRQEATEKAKKQSDAPQAEAPVAQPDPHAPPPAPPPDPIPPGFTNEEWGELPDHVKEIVRRRSAGA